MFPRPHSPKIYNLAEVYKVCKYIRNHVCSPFLFSFPFCYRTRNIVGPSPPLVFFFSYTRSVLPQCGKYTVYKHHVKERLTELNTPSRTWAGDPRTRRGKRTLLPYTGRACHVNFFLFLPSPPAGVLWEMTFTAEGTSRFRPSSNPGRTR